MDFAKNVLKFFSTLKITTQLPPGVEVLNPYGNANVQGLISSFYQKYYSDTNSRVFLIGINPGRLGSGATGIGFTDPINLEDYCGITNDLTKKHELSSRFIYSMINSMGGADLFYKSFYFTSVSPLGFARDGRNLNYYDVPELQIGLEAFMVDSLQQQIKFGAHPVAFSIGQGKNIAYLNYLNEKHRLFEKIIALPHPRWIMQYRLKRLEEFIQLYSTHLRPLLNEEK